jgi:hypothetical protein
MEVLYLAPVIEIALEVLRIKFCQVELLITNNAFCIVQRAAAQSKTGIFRDYGVAEAPPWFQASWPDCMFSFSLFLCPPRTPAKESGFA